MKFLYLTPFAATVVSAARTHSTEFDYSAYAADYAFDIPTVNRGEVFYEGEDPYVN